MCYTVKCPQELRIADRPYVNVQVGVGTIYVAIRVGKKIGERIKVFEDSKLYNRPQECYQQ